MNGWLPNPWFSPPAMQYISRFTGLPLGNPPARRPRPHPHDEHDQRIDLYRQRAAGGQDIFTGEQREGMVPLPRVERPARPRARAVRPMPAPAPWQAAGPDVEDPVAWRARTLSRLPQDRLEAPMERRPRWPGGDPETLDEHLESLRRDDIMFRDDMQWDMDQARYPGAGEYMFDREYDPNPRRNPYHAGGGVYLEGRYHPGGGRQHRHPPDGSYHYGGGRNFHDVWFPGGGYYRNGPAVNYEFADYPSSNPSNYHPGGGVYLEGRYHAGGGRQHHHGRAASPFHHGGGRMFHDVWFPGGGHFERNGPIVNYEFADYPSMNPTSSGWTGGPRDESRSGPYTISSAAEEGDCEHCGEPAFVGDRAFFDSRTGQTFCSRGCSIASGQALQNPCEPGPNDSLRCWTRNPYEHQASSPFGGGPEPRHDVLCQCGWGRLGMPESQIPESCPVCGHQLGQTQEEQEEYEGYSENPRRSYAPIQRRPQGRFFTMSPAIEHEGQARLLEAPWSGGVIPRTIETSEQHGSRMKGHIRSAAKKLYGINLKDDTIETMLGLSRAQLVEAGHHRLAKIKALADRSFYAQTRGVRALPSTEIPKGQRPTPAKGKGKKKAEIKKVQTSKKSKKKVG